MWTNFTFSLKIDFKNAQLNKIISVLNINIVILYYDELSSSVWLIVFSIQIVIVVGQLID